LLGVLALGTVIVGIVSDLRSRLGGGRRLGRRHRRPWDEYLMVQDAYEHDADSDVVEASPRAREQRVELLRLPESPSKHALGRASDDPVARHAELQPATPVKNTKSIPSLRLVEATPWPLGSGHSTSPKKTGRLAPVTQLGFPVTRPSDVRGFVREQGVEARPQARERSMPRVARTPAWHEPGHYTPYPFSVWSYHDKLPDGYDESYAIRQSRGWLWATLIFTGVVLASMLCWRAFGISMPFSI
jgi:hypothetical protein